MRRTQSPRVTEAAAAAADAWYRPGLVREFRAVRGLPEPTVPEERGVIIDINALRQARDRAERAE